jgi:hypothetical protein
MVPSAREAHLAVLMIGYSDPLTRRLACLVRPSPPDGWCAIGRRLQGQRSAQRKGSSGWPQVPAPIRRPKAEALSGEDREALAEALGKQARVGRSRVFCSESVRPLFSSARPYLVWPMRRRTPTGSTDLDPVTSCPREETVSFPARALRRKSSRSRRRRRTCEG